MSRETKNLEFKERVSTTFLKTVSAFANYGGGIIRFGVREDGTLAGLGTLKNSALVLLESNTPIEIALFSLALLLMRRLFLFLSR